MSKLIRRAFAFLAILLLGAIAAQASVTGSFSGTVNDPSGAVVRTARVCQRVHHQWRQRGGGPQ